MTLTPRPQEEPRAVPLVCWKCKVTGHEDPTVYQRVTITGTRLPPTCGHCAHKVDRMARLSRRGECAE